MYYTRAIKRNNYLLSRKVHIQPLGGQLFQTQQWKITKQSMLNCFKINFTPTRSKFKLQFEVANFKYTSLRLGFQKFLRFGRNSSSNKKHVYKDNKMEIIEPTIAHTSGLLMEPSMFYLEHMPKYKMEELPLVSLLTELLSSL